MLMEFCSHGAIGVFHRAQVEKTTKKKAAVGEHYTICNLGMGPQEHFRLQALEQVGSALQFLHDNGVIQGDIKPDNILVKSKAENDSPLIIKVCDFDFSFKLQPGKEDQPKVSCHEGVPGTNGFK